MCYCLCAVDANHISLYDHLNPKYLIDNPIMPSIDRLSCLMARFELRVVPVTSSDAQLFVYADTVTGEPNRVVLSLRGGENLHDFAGEVIMFKARVEWGGNTNPLFHALPAILELKLDGDTEITAITSLLKSENAARRCGSGSVLCNLCEILIVRLMRAHLERGHVEVGLFGGLADPRLSRAIVAIHEDPGKKWKNADLASIAGLSLSRFAELFANVVGETPFGYLRRWRLVLARQDIAQGARIQKTAAKYGYQSGEALSRAFYKQFGEAPTSVRRQYARL